MSKYPCGLIEDLIPLYIEGDVSDATKEILEKHLKDCKDCSALVQQYSNDELNLEDFKIDLPKADTFKKWMKRLKIWGLITAVVVMFAAIAIGVIGYKIGEKPKNDLLTLKSIVKTFEKQGVSLREDKSKSSEEYPLNGIKPAVYSLGENKGTLLIYTFKSFVERDEIVREANKFNNQYSVLQFTFNAKNAFLVYISSQNPTTEEELKIIGETKELISKIVFKYLNDGKEFTYKGESSSWEGTLTTRYYEHWWKDEKGTLHHESYNEKDPVIKYKMLDIEAVGPIDFEYKVNATEGKLTGAELNAEGYLKFGKSGGNGSIPREEDAVNFTVKWNGKEENIVLKVK